jgi:hypothetical protein
MPVNSNREQVEAQMALAEEAGLIAAGNKYRNLMTVALQGGYTSGAFYSGMQGIAGSVSVSAVQQDSEGRFVTVGTNNVYGKFWELGHMNLFTGKYERVEKWRPTMDENATDIIETYWRIHQRVMQRAA